LLLLENILAILYSQHEIALPLSTLMGWGICVLWLLIIAVSPENSRGIMKKVGN